jgi:hypothetical protein
VRQFLPDAYSTVVARLPLCTDDAARARLAADLGPIASRERRPAAAADLVAALTAPNA